MEIYYADIGLLREEDVFLEKLKEIPEARRERLQHYRKAEDRKRSLLAGLLLEYGLNERGLTLLSDRRQYRSVALQETEGGKPCISGETGVFFNLSHSGNYAAAVFDEQTVGIDMEQLERADAGRKIAYRFFMQEEAEYLAGVKAEREAEYAFTRLWTRKESYLKATGFGMRLPMNTFSVLGDETVKRELSGSECKTGYFLKTWELPECYCISVCARGKINAEPRQLDREILR